MDRRWLSYVLHTIDAVRSSHLQDTACTHWFPLNGPRKLSNDSNYSLTHCLILLKLGRLVHHGLRTTGGTSELKWQCSANWHLFWFHFSFNKRIGLGLVRGVWPWSWPVTRVGLIVQYIPGLMHLLCVSWVISVHTWRHGLDLWLSMARYISSN